jgi:SAM-dependent methyltransferase
MKTIRKKEWFDDDAFWRELYPFMFPEKRLADATREVDQALRLMKPKGKLALNLCCGPGRCSVALARRGYSVAGVDRTQYLLAQARRRAKSARVRIEWVRADMRDFVRPGAFDLVLSMFTSFGYFDDKREDLTVLQNMFASLRPGGACLIDVVAKEYLAKVFQPTKSEVLPDGSRIVQRREIFDAWTRIRNEWILIRRGRARSFTFHHTVYSGQELSDRMKQVGFAGVRLYGDLSGGDYGTSAQRLIAVGRKSKTQAAAHRPASP